MESSAKVGRGLAHVCNCGYMLLHTCARLVEGFPGGALSQAALRRSFVTAGDVARRAGVSRSAVSRAFTPGASVSTEVRERILQAADQLGYRVNRLAQGLINARSNVVGLVGTDLQQPFHAELLATLSGALLADGYQCMLLNAANAERDMSALIARLLEYRVCAIVVMSGMPPSRVVEECLGNGVPVILVNKPLPDLDVDTVVADHAAGGRVAAEQLLAAGCRRLGIVSSAARTASLTGRLDAFLARAGEAGAACTSGRTVRPITPRDVPPRSRCSATTRSTASSASPICWRWASSTPPVPNADAACPTICRSSASTTFRKRPGAPTA